MDTEQLNFYIKEILEPHTKEALLYYQRIIKLENDLRNYQAVQAQTDPAKAVFAELESFRKRILVLEEARKVQINLNENLLTLKERYLKLEQFIAQKEANKSVMVSVRPSKGWFNNFWQSKDR